MPKRTIHTILVLLALLAPAPAAWAGEAAASLESDTLHWSSSPAMASDSLRFKNSEPDTGTALLRPTHKEGADEDEWLQAPFGEGLLTDLDRWRARGKTYRDDDVVLDYNRVDQLRLGLHVEYGPRYGLSPRLGGRFEYAFGRDRSLYGLQIEQPLLETGQFAAGATFSRRTAHNDLQHMEDAENTLALLFGRQDYRDYFEREGSELYVIWRIPDFSTVSLRLGEDTWRSLQVDRGTRSWFHTDRPLRDNPAIDEGDTRTWTLRLERLLHRSARTRAGLYHWLELERSGAGLGGDFDYTRALGDVRSVARLSPATTLSLRLVAGSALAGTLPKQKEFTLGGVDGLRAHNFGQFRGDQIALAQAEYTVGLWRVSSDLFEGGLHALVFVDAGRAWTNPERRWDASRQEMQSDGGFGFSTSEDNVRVYFARNLQKPDADFVVSLRLNRPF